MKVQRLEITDFRGIASLDWECEGNVNVIAGVNGAGKSTVLKALEILLSWMKARIRNERGNGIAIESRDIREGAQFTTLKMETDVFSMSLVKKSPSFREKTVQTNLSEMSAFANVVAESLGNDSNASSPVMASYSVNRSVIDIPKKVRKKHCLDTISLYNEDIDAGVNLRAFYEWFKEREEIENSEYRYNPNFVEDHQLKAVRNAIRSFLPGYGDLRVQRNRPWGFVISKDGTDFHVEQLSDGEKCYITLVGDIARHLAICNPASEDPLLANGIILIDEVELHLHPSWQASIIDRMRSTFPNVQFFFTTHSPHIVQNIRCDQGDSLIVLDGGAEIRQGVQYGSMLNDVLTDVFCLDTLRPKAVDDQIERVWELLRQGDCGSDDLEDRINGLKKMVGPGDSEFVKINMQISFNKRHAHAQN